MSLQEKVRYMVKDVLEGNRMLVGTDSSTGDELLVKGSFSSIFPGDTLCLYGSFKQSKLLGRYFEAAFYREYVNEFWIAKWLKLDKGYTDEQIVSMLVLKKGIASILPDWENVTKTYNLFKHLSSKSVPDETLAALEKKHRWRFSELLANPYLLLTFISISYSLVQEVIAKFNLADPPSEKGKYLLEHMLRRAHEQGHLFLPAQEADKELKRQGVALSDVNIELPFFKEEDRLYLREHYDTECQITQHLQQRLSRDKHVTALSTPDEWQERKGFTLAKNQVEAVNMSLLEPFSIVTGGPGVGKTTVCNCITDLLGENASIYIVAPTGRAAKRAQESTGLPASTIHRLLEYNGFTFRRNRDYPIEIDVLVIDESSMVDATLFLALLEAVPQETKIIVVGDVDQLPSVGAGQVLKDLIDSGAVPVTKLTEIFRQAAGSPIISCAYAVNRGEVPELVSHPDLQYLEGSEDEVFRSTVQLASQLYQEHGLFDVQVLIPMYRGPVGIDRVNQALQASLNPNVKGVRIGSYEVRIGDKVIQTRNDYGRGINNGDVGAVISATPQKIEVLFHGTDKPVPYAPDDFPDLALSYAITVHRSQGSEYANVIIPVVDSYSVMLQKNLLYTAITRAKKKLWIHYQRSALESAVRLESVPTRYTTLAKMLKEKEESGVA